MSAKIAIVQEDRGSSVNLVPHLLSISKCVRQLMGIKLAECGVVVGQDQFLLCFEGADTLGSIQIANRLSVRPSTVSKMVDILERKGWVQRESDEGDHRRVLVRLTSAGRTLADRVRNVQVELETELLAAISNGNTILPAIKELDQLLAKRLRRLR